MHQKQPTIEQLKTLTADKPKNEPDALPPGCWELSGLTGSRAGVVKAITDNATLPEHAKTFVLAQIATLDAKFNHLVVHAHVHCEKGVYNFDMTITPSTQL